MQDRAAHLPVRADIFKVCGVCITMQSHSCIVSSVYNLHLRASETMRDNYMYFLVILSSDQSIMVQLHPCKET